MDLFSGLEKFGLDTSKIGDIFSMEDSSKKKQAAGAKEKEVPKESDFLMEKSVSCPVCDRKFKTIVVKTGKAKRLESDKDLRPRYQYVDTLKYNVASCPYCGYSAMRRSFNQLTYGQKKLIRENIGAKFEARGTVVEELPPEYDYDTAIQLYKLALYNAVVKKGKMSERAYICLMISWLYRGKCEAAKEKGGSEDSNSMKKDREEEYKFYAEAFIGMAKAADMESSPICGMDENTVDILLAEMAFLLRKYDVSSRYLYRAMSSRSANRKIKDKALELKQEILAVMKAQKSGSAN